MSEHTHNRNLLSVIYTMAASAGTVLFYYALSSLLGFLMEGISGWYPQVFAAMCITGSAAMTFLCGYGRSQIEGQYDHNIEKAASFLCFTAAALLTDLTAALLLLTAGLIPLSAHLIRKKQEELQIPFRILQAGCSLLAAAAICVVLLHLHHEMPLSEGLLTITLIEEAGVILIEEIRSYKETADSSYVTAAAHFFHGAAMIFTALGILHSAGKSELALPYCMIFVILASFISALLYQPCQSPKEKKTAAVLYGTAVCVFICRISLPAGLLCAVIFLAACIAFPLLFPQESEKTKASACAMSQIYIGMMLACGIFLYSRGICGSADVLLMMMSILPAHAVLSGRL
ncbi:MAG: hypothetical protein K6A40_10955 [Solobacterium sp.]|nr:hypothetical protein [Solobacterium sp.]